MEFAMIKQLKLNNDYLDFGTCFIRYEYVRNCTISNESQVMGKFLVQPHDSQIATISKLFAQPLEGPVIGNSSTSIEYKLATSILGDIAFVTTVISSPSAGIYEMKMPLRIEALSIGQ